MDNVVEAQPTVAIRLRWKIQNFKWWVRARVVNIGLALIRMVTKENNYRSHALREFEALGWPDGDDMQELICENILDLLAVFSTQGHSGSSAPYAIGHFEKLASFEPLGPLTGDACEWGESFDNDGSMQNKRCSHVFKDGDGRAYDIDGKVFREPDGCCFTSKDSRVYVDFPYTPKTEYVDVPKSSD